MRRSHETWWHLTKGPRYFTGIDEIREPHGRSDPTAGGANSGPNAGRKHGAGVLGDIGHLSAAQPHPLGKLPGSVWTIPTQPLRVPPELGIDHFAAQPMEWPRRIIRGWSPSGICVECGEGRRPVVEKTHDPRRPSGVAAVGRDYTRPDRSNGHTVANVITSATVTGYVCACDAPTAPTRPAVILDPFGGTGTTGVVAKALGRHAHLVDLSRDYCRLAQWRVNDPRELAKAAQVKPPAKRKAKVTKLRPAPESQQESLLDDGSAA